MALRCVAPAQPGAIEEDDPAQDKPAILRRPTMAPAKARFLTRHLRLGPALLRKSAAGRAFPFPGLRFPATSAMGLPRAGNPFRTGGTRDSAT
jgi:hypothetical protein